MNYPRRVNNLSRSLYRQVRDALQNKRLRSDKILGDPLIWAVEAHIEILGMT